MNTIAIEIKENTDLEKDEDSRRGWEGYGFLRYLESRCSFKKGSSDMFLVGSFFVSMVLGHGACWVAFVSMAVGQGFRWGRGCKLRLQAQRTS